MDFKKFNEIAELVGMAAIVLSLLFVGLQLKQSQQLAVEENVNFSNERQNAIRSLIVENAEVWHKACIGEPLDPAARIIAAKIYGAWLDHAGAEYFLRSSGIRQSEESQQRVIEELAAQFVIYPGLRELGKSKDDYGRSVDASSGAEEMGVLIRKRADELVSRGDIPEADTAWCGRT